MFRFYHDPVRSAPAHQCLCTCDLIIMKRYFRLKIDLEFSLFHGFIHQQFHCRLAFFALLQRHQFFSYGILVSSGDLGAVQSEICVFEKLFIAVRSGATRQKADTHAAAHRKFLLRKGQFSHFFHQIPDFLFQHFPVDLF